MITRFEDAKGSFQSPDYRLYVNGNEVFVYYCESASFAIVTAAGRLDVRVEPAFAFRRAVVRPLSKGISVTRAEQAVMFSCSAPAKLSVEFDGGLCNPLFLFLHEPETDAPSPDSPSVRYYKSGFVYDEGPIELTDNQTLYIEEGAVVYGSVLAKNAAGITIRGRGILSGQKHFRGDVFKDDHKRMMEFLNCSELTIRDVVLFDGPSWHLVLVHCLGVEIRGVSIISQRMTGDGIDIVGSSSVTVSGYFARTNDDCIAIKGCDYQYEEGCNNVENVLVENSVFWNATYGNALEIGYETRCEAIRGITFRNCDIIHCQYEGYESGGALTIHNGDRAVVSDVLYDDIRIENCEQKLIDFKVLRSGWSKDAQRGYIRNIRLRNIQIADGKLPPSIIRGYQPDHLIENVVVENLTVRGVKAEDFLDAKMIVELARGVKIL